MGWQYDPQKAQLDHKGQICTKFHKCKYNGFRIAVRKRKCDARPSARPPDGHQIFPLTTIPETNFCLG